MTQTITNHDTQWSPPTGPKTSASFTPPANSKVYVMAYCESFTAGNIPAITSTALSFTQLDSAGPSGSFNGYTKFWEADSGATPAAMTVSFSAPAGGSYDISYAIFSVSGNGIGIKQRAAISNSIAANAPTGTLAAAAVSGNLVISVEQGNRDLSVALTGPSGFTALIANPGTGSKYQGAAIYYSTTFTGTSSTWTNPESGTGNNSSTVFMEMQETGVSVPILVETGFMLLNESGNPLMTE